MNNKAVISEFTYRGLAEQRSEYAGMPIYVLPQDLSALMRPTNRKSAQTFHCVSLATLAKTEKDFRDFLKGARKLQAFIQTKGGKVIMPHEPFNQSVDLWKKARREGVAKAGGEAMADRSERKFWEGFAKIMDRWHLPAVGQNVSPDLLAEADLTRNTVKAYLGYTRLEWRKLTEGQRNRILKRAERRKAKA